MSKSFRLIVAISALSLAATPAAAAPKTKWVASWASSQIPVEGPQALEPADLTDATLRQVVRVTLGGQRVRVRLSNAFGTQPLRVAAARVAYSGALGTAAIDPASDRQLTFGGRPEVTIPAGAEMVSDAVALPLAPRTRVAISLHIPQPPSKQTGHPGSRATSFVARGDQTSAAGLTNPKKFDRWHQIAGLEVEAPVKSAVIAMLGDSITDGYGVQPNTDSRWPDFLMERLQASSRTRHLGIVNAGIGGNRLLLDGIGPNALARLERDVLGQPGVTHMVVLIGVNDLGTLTRDAPVSPEEHAALVARLLAGYEQLAHRARSHGIKVIGATILPYGGSGYYHPDAANEADRQAINRWLRTPGNVDGLIDFDAALRDPAKPTHLAKQHDSGDGLHPSIAGYRAMAAAVPLALFTR